MKYSDLSIKALLLLTSVKTACCCRNNPNISRDELWSYGCEAAAELLSCGLVTSSIDDQFAFSPDYWQTVRSEGLLKVAEHS